LLIHQIPNSPEFPPEMRGARVLMLDESGDCICLAQQLLNWHTCHTMRPRGIRCVMLLPRALVWLGQGAATNSTASGQISGAQINKPSGLTSNYTLSSKHHSAFELT
jgi:hypothetical protein